MEFELQAKIVSETGPWSIFMKLIADRSDRVPVSERINGRHTPPSNGE